MATYSETKGQLVINLMDGEIYQSQSANNQVNLNELYLIRGQDTDEVVEVKYVASGSKFVYTTVDGNQVDIVTLAGLKTLLGYASVAASGQYSDLSGKPSINGVELSGNKSTSDLNIVIDYTSDSLTNKPKINGVTLTGDLASSLLGISYNDLSDLPAIPAVSDNYISGSSGAALTSAGIDKALANYVPKTRIVSGSGALSGGGDLTANRTITHKTAPTGLNTSAIKVGVDSYGHVCAGPAITPADIAAMPLKTTTASSLSGLDGSNTSILVVGSQSEALGFSSAPELGKKVSIFYVNNSTSPLNIVIPNSLTDVTFVNGTQISSNYTHGVDAGKSVELEVVLFQASGTTYGFVKIS